MLLLATAFAGGVIILQWCAGLPPLWAYSVVPLALLSLVWRAVRLPAVFILGFFWTALLAEFALDPALDPVLEGKTVLVEGRVLDRPRQITHRQTRFLFYIERLDAGQGWSDFQGKVRLSSYSPDLKVAHSERWQLAVRLKRPHGFSNPGGFDFEQWLFQQGIMATGYVRQDKARNRLLSVTGVSIINRFRSRLMSAYDGMSADTPSLAIIRALTIGDRSALSTSQWEVLRATGTSHLVAISGLHVSLVAGLVFWLARFVWMRCGYLVERCPANKVAAVVAVFAALAYALLAGFGIPVRRALIMVSIFMLSIVSDQNASFSRSIALAVMIILLLDPLAVLSPGWWLSFWAVTVIAYCIGGRRGTRGFTQKWVYMHLVLALTMVPLLLVFFQQASVIAPLANSVAVPFVGMLVVPVALIGTLGFSLSETAGEWVLRAAAEVMDIVWPWLDSLAGLEFALWQQHQPVAWTLVPAFVGLAILFMPRGMPGRWLALLLLLPLVVVEPERPEWGEAQLTLLDVGQGLSAVVQTQRHVLVYDAGPRFSETFDTGKAVVAPFLRHSGIRKLNMLIVSHGDNDHIGGVASLLADFPADQLLTSVTEKMPVTGARDCWRDQRWVWEGVSFTLLHPYRSSQFRGNDASCVLRIESAGGHRVMLTGDIEGPAEQALLRQPRQQLSAAVLVAPHHGSDTSSTPAFIKAVYPDIVLFPSGYRNRYGFPKSPVVDRYADIHAEMYETGLSGALTVTLSSDDEKPAVRRFRDERRRYWQPVKIP
ncbi:MAG: DNA internalization-related competence protein ComEC/Rec2 [Pseudomonadota bacterium]